MRTPLLLYGLALAVRLVLIWHFPDPASPHSFYYVDVARALHAGQGFNVDFIWIFPEVGGSIPADPVLPIPSNAHWMPLASIVQVPFIALLGATAWASALPFALIGSIAAPLTWAIARDAGAGASSRSAAGSSSRSRSLPRSTSSSPTTSRSTSRSSSGRCGWGRAACDGSARSFALAGLLAGAATLSRNDGLLVLAALGVAFAWDRWRAWRAGGGSVPAIPVSAALACVVLFAAS